jgi:hypothetical protein
VYTPLLANYDPARRKVTLVIAEHLAIQGSMHLSEVPLTLPRSSTYKGFSPPRSLYHRVDVIESSRHVRVSVNGEVVAALLR